jgi:hypothetical protein
MPLAFRHVSSFHLRPLLPWPHWHCVQILVPDTVVLGLDTYARKGYLEVSQFQCSKVSAALLVTSPTHHQDVSPVRS